MGIFSGRIHSCRYTRKLLIIVSVLCRLSSRYFEDEDRILDLPSKIRWPGMGRPNGDTFMDDSDQSSTSTQNMTDTLNLVTIVVECCTVGSEIQQST